MLGCSDTVTGLLKTYLSTLCSASAYKATGVQYYCVTSTVARVTPSTARSNARFISYFDELG